MIPPGSTIGILGGGQLGRMIALAGRRMGYRFHIYDPSPTACAQSVADVFVNAAYEDKQALEAFASQVDVVTLEFENIPTEALETLEWQLPVRPDSRTLSVCQSREREKCFLGDEGFPCAPFAVVDSQKAVLAQAEKIGFPSVLKTAAWGYDGKGQVKLQSLDDVLPAWEKLGGERAVIEKWIPHKGEFSVICARNRHGETQAFPVSENIHTNHILDISLLPARIDPALAKEAEELARAIMDALGTVGLLAVELFLSDEGWLVNELAPRPHNSGHHTFDACVTNQFEQCVRAVCDLPLGSVDLLRPVAMLNLLGEVWQKNPMPDWAGLLSQPDLKLHLYDKGKAAVGRKMGHLCVFAESADEAYERVLAIRKELYPEN